MTLTQRINRREDSPTIVPLIERRQSDEPFVAPWRRRQIKLAGGDRFRAMNDLTEAA